MIEINCWIKRSDKKHFNQDLKIQLQFWMDKVKIQNGKINIKTFIMMYLKEYVKIKLKRPVVEMNFKMPSKDNKLKLDSIEIHEFNSFINWEKQISLLYRVSPSSRIADEIVELIKITCSDKKNELFIKIPINKILKMNFNGFTKLKFIYVENSNWIQ